MAPALQRLREKYPRGDSFHELLIHLVSARSCFIIASL